jgi:hypothetical protein
MIEDEFGPQSVAADIRSQGGQRMPKQFDVRVWAVIAIIIALLVVLMI